MRRTFAFTTTLTLLLTWGFKAEAGWNIVSSPDADAYTNVLLAQHATSSSDIWAVGYYDSADPGLENASIIQVFSGHRVGKPGSHFRRRITGESKSADGYLSKLLASSSRKDIRYKGCRLLFT